MKTKNESNVHQVPQSFNLDRESEELRPERITKKVKSLPSSVTTTSHTTFDHNSFVNGVNQFSGTGWTNTTFYTSPIIHPIEKVCELYERIIKDKDSKLQDLEKRVTELDKKVESFLKE